MNSQNGCDSVLKYVDANMAQAFMVVVTYGSELPQYSDTHHCQSVFPEQSWNSVVGEDAGSGGGGSEKNEGTAMHNSHRDSSFV